MMDADSDYERYLKQVGPDTYNAPVSSWEERATRQATVVITLPRKDVQRLVTPPLPQLSPRGVKHRPAPTVEDVINESTILYDDRRGYFSGSPAGYSGTSRNNAGGPF